MKRTLVSIVAAGIIAGGSLAALQIDPSRFDNAITNIISLSNPVDLGKTISRTQLKTALSNAAEELGYGIDFNEVYQKGYRLGSVSETNDYRGTEVDVSIGLIRGLDLYISGGNERAGLYIEPSGFVSDEEIRQYLSVVSNYISEQ